MFQFPGYKLVFSSLVEYLIPWLLPTGERVCFGFYIIRIPKHYYDRAETYTLLTQCLHDEHSDVRQAGVGALALHNYGDGIKPFLLSSDLDGSNSWQDPLVVITKDRVRRAAEHLNLTRTEIRQHYSDISVDIPLILEWRT